MCVCMGGTFSTLLVPKVKNCPRDPMDSGLRTTKKTVCPSAQGMKTLLYSAKDDGTSGAPSLRAVMSKHADLRASPFVNATLT